MIKFSSIFCSMKPQKCQNEAFTIWNTNKEGGWSRYKELTEDDISVVETHQKDDISTTNVMCKIDKVMTRINHSDFGKVKRKRNIVKRMASNSDELPEDTNSHLLKIQREEVEEEFKKIKEIKTTKGKTAAIFSTMKKIKGDTKSGPELVAMKHPETEELVFDPEKLKSVSLNYCVNLLQNKEVDEDFKDEIYTENLVHYLRMEEDDIETCELKEEDFLARLKKISKKQGEKYKFILEKVSITASLIYSNRFGKLNRNLFNGEIPL
jgi:hypothetical protein